MLLKLVLILSVFEIYNCAEIESIEDDENCLEFFENDTSTYFHDSLTTVRFFLINPQNETIELNSTNLNLVDSSNPTKYVIHGLETHDNRLWIDKIASVYHKIGNYNIIAVDWAITTIQDRDYLVEAVDAVGDILGIFILQVTNMDTQLLSQTHLIGSSLGAQVSGVAGGTVAKKGGKVGRITGLDPTVPDSVDELDEEDADFVDVIHTSVYVGDRTCGVVDFYVVDEDGEPICYYSNNTDNATCSNLLANDYYIESIEDKFRFEGISCYNASAQVEEMCDRANSAIMGEYVPRNISGSYLVSKDVAAGIHNHSNYLLIFSIAVSLSILFR